MASARIDHPYKTVGNFKFEGEDSSIYIWSRGKALHCLA